jgi:creatinine amidohydrolase
MGLGVDTYCCYLTCKLTRRELEASGIRMLISLPYYWGFKNATGFFAGSFTVRRETMKALLYDTLDSLRRWGFTYVFNINWHGDHDRNVATHEAVKEARVDTGIRAYCVFTNLYAKHFGFTGKEYHVIILSPAEEPPQNIFRSMPGRSRPV